MHDLALESAPGREIHAGLVASTASICWTALSSAVAVGYGVSAGSIVLVAFGAVGVFDMAGSIALIAHFRHALRHQSVSERHERAAQLIVSIGMLTVGVATLVGSTLRLVAGGHTAEPLAGLIATASSIAVLGYLGLRKRRIGRLIPSAALMTDGSLSLTGCGTAICAVVGLALNDAYGWAWIDPVAAIGVAVAAIGVSLRSLGAFDR